MGRRVFLSTDITHFWDGTRGRKNKLVQEGVYTWKIKYTSNKDIDKTLVGHLSLLKSLW